jgi:DNA-binding SARP family transcriptional activator
MLERTVEQVPTTAGSTMEIFLLGSPSVRWSGRPVDISRRQVRALLYRLAASGDGVPREQLCFLFWPDEPESGARRKLTGLLAHLRRSLPEPEVVVAADDKIGLVPELVWSDVIAFKDLSSSRPAELLPAALRRAADHYRGPFLDGFSLPENPEYETWITIQRQSFERIYLEALTALIEELAASADFAAAIAYAQRYLETDDLAEGIHRRLMQLYVSSGDRSAALRQFEQCAEILARELDVEPLPETQAAYQAALESHPAGPADLVVRPMEPSWTTLPGLDVRLVGREETQRQLQKAYADARGGRGGVFLISGEPGIGKSRLMQDFATSLAEEALVLTGAGHRDARARPYQPIVEALRPAVIAYHASLDVPAWSLAELARLMPELRLLSSDLSAPAADGVEQARATLFDALGNLILGLSNGRGPVLLCLDDLQWADGTTLDWLAYMGRWLAGATPPATGGRGTGSGQGHEGAAQAGVLVVATYRDEGISALTELRRSLTREGVVTEVELGGLDEGAVAELLQQLGDSLPCDEALARHLRQVTGGNPFFLMETVRAIIEAGCQPADLAQPENLCLPDTVLDAVEARLARLSPQAKQVLEAGAVLGRSFSLGLVRQTSGRRDLETMDALDELVARHLLEEGTTGYWFRHEITRGAVYRQLSRGRRQMLHRRAGEALERLEPDNAAALAWHFERADEPARAARYALRAGQAAKAVFAHVEARAHYDKALELLQWEAVDLQDPEAVEANRRLQIEALHGRGWALRLLGDMETYAQDLEGVARLAQSLGDPRTMAHLCWRKAYTHRWFCRYAEAGAQAQEGVRLSQEAADPLLQAMCLREVGLAARATGEYGVARAALEQALKLFVELGETVYEIHTMGNLATLLWYERAYEGALDLSRQALERCEEAGLSLERRLPLGDMGAAASALHAVELAWSCLEESLTLARQTADRTQEILCLTHLGWLSIRVKQPAEALGYLQEGLALAQRVGSCAEQSWLRSGLAEAHRLVGDDEEARSQARQALELAQEHGAAYDQKLARRVLGRLGVG